MWTPLEDGVVAEITSRAVVTIDQLSFSSRPGRDIVIAMLTILGPYMATLKLGK